MALSRQALEVIEAAKRLSGNAPFVFPSARHVHRPMSENAIGYFYNRLPDYRGRHVPHGWRATFSTVMNEKAKAENRLGDREVIDLMLAHIPKEISSSEGAYNRAAYLPRAARARAGMGGHAAGGLSPRRIADRLLAESQCGQHPAPRRVGQRRECDVEHMFY